MTSAPERAGNGRDQHTSEDRRLSDAAAAGHEVPVVPGAALSVVLLVDGHAYAYRAFHAIASLKSPSGRPTNALYGFIKMYRKLVEQVRPTHVVVVWDGGLDEERLRLLPEYKAQRPSMPQDLALQLDDVVEFLQASGIPSICHDGEEADDRLAWLAREAAKAGARVVLASGDKDFMQLVDERIGLVNPNDREFRIWTSAEVVAKTGVSPAQVADWLSLIGDGVDNIAGVPGVGPKTATQLLTQFGSVQQLLARLTEVTSIRIRQAIQSATDVLLRNQALVRLERTFPEPFSLEQLRPATADKGRLRRLFAQSGFKTLLAELGELEPSQPCLL